MFHFELNGTSVQCDTAAELREAVASGGGPKTASARGTPRTKKRSGKGTKKSWAEARTLANKDGISVMEARTRLAKQKKQKTK